MVIKKELVGHLACFTAYAIWGFNIIVCKDLTSGNLLSPFALFTLRSIFAGALFWITSLFMPKETIAKKDYIKILLASILGFFMTQVSFLMAIPRITPMDCSIITALSPIFTMLIAAIVLKEPITLKKVSGVLVSFLGIIYLILNAVSNASTALVTTPAGVAFMLLNCFSFSLYLGIFKPLIAKYSPITFMKWIFLFSTILSLPISIKELYQFNYQSVSVSFVLELMYLIIFATFVAYFLIPVGQQRIRPTLVSMYTYVQPIIAIGISIFIGMDVLSWQKIVAAVMVFTGVLLVNNSKTVQK